MCITMSPKVLDRLWIVDIITCKKPCKAFMYKCKSYKKDIIEFDLMIKGIHFLKISRSEVRKILTENYHLIDEVYDAIFTKFKSENIRQKISFSKNTKLKMEIDSNEKGEVNIKLPSSEF